MDKDIPYFAINVPNDTCLVDILILEMMPNGGIHSKIKRNRLFKEIIKQPFNKGKQQEVEMRTKHG